MPALINNIFINGISACELRKLAVARVWMRLFGGPSYASGGIIPAMLVVGPLGEKSTALRSIKEDCLKHVVPLVVPIGEGFLRTAVKEYVELYNQERPHQGLDNELVTEMTEKCDLNAPVKFKERLGGLLNYYYR